VSNSQNGKGPSPSQITWIVKEHHHDHHLEFAHPGVTNWSPCSLSGTRIAYRRVDIAGEDWLHELRLFAFVRISLLLAIVI
jgi:hypothetical protein